MLRTVASDSARARRMPRRSPLTKVTCALDMATSVPVPMAMPTSALASAGASLMPSPAIATLRPCACSRLTSAALSSGFTSPWTSSMPSARATACAVVAPSPVAITTRRPLACNAAMVGLAEGLIGSATASRPSKRPSPARNITLAPSARRVSASAASDATSMSLPSIRARLPSSSARPSTVPRTPDPVTESKSCGFESTRVRWRASATMDSASGCSLPWSRLAARRRTSAASLPAAPTTVRKVGLPSVRVPVLSTTRVSRVRKRSIASASRNSTPAWAARPVATMIDIGVARPSAHGQAMISTETALSTAHVQEGCGPHRPQAKKVAIAAASTASTNQ